MTCSNCQAACQLPTWGGYDFACAGCCARLILSAHPDRNQALVMKDAIKRFPKHPNLKAVMALVNDQLTSPRPSPEESLF